MTNELLLVIIALIDIIFVFISARLSSQRLYGMIALNLFLVTIFGAKLITVAGFTTNVSNVFYACVFLSTHLLLERYAKKEVFKTIWFGCGAVIFFLVLSQLAVHIESVIPGDSIDEAMRTLFVLSPRLALASILAFLFAQYVNIRIYAALKAKTGRNYMWLRSNVANIVGQLVDSCIFFTVAFIDLPGGMLLEAILVGWVVKIIVVMLATPMIYMDRYLIEQKN